VSFDALAGAAAGPFAAACAVLAFAGATKIRHPRGVQGAVSALGLPVSPPAIRALGIIEAGAALTGLVLGGAAAIAVALVYASLAVAAWRLLVRSPGTACGCLGASTAPVTATHVIVDVMAAVAALFATAAGPPLAAVGSSLWLRLVFVVLAGCGAALVALLLDALPALDAATREGGSP
jgi:hypothetical protein